MLGRRTLTAALTQCLSLTLCSPFSSSHQTCKGSALSGVLGCSTRQAYLFSPSKRQSHCFDWLLAPAVVQTATLRHLQAGKPLRPCSTLGQSSRSISVLIPSLHLLSLLPRYLLLARSEIRRLRAFGGSQQFVRRKMATVR